MFATLFQNLILIFRTINPETMDLEVERSEIIMEPHLEHVSIFQDARIYNQSCV